jgi:UDP-N-acetylmuramyl tripeptide synthase
MNPSSSQPAQRSLFEQVWLDGLLEQHLDAVYSERFEPSGFLNLADAPSLTYTKLAVARAAGRVSRASGQGGGTTAPGRHLLRMAPVAMGPLAARLRGGVTLVSATNGKTTTARMLAAILEADGCAVVHNRAGANTHWGVATALTERDGDIGVFEVDEAWLPLLAAVLRPRVVVLGNLFRDRLDGYGELDRLVSIWRTLLRGPAPETVVVNADDPLLAGPGGVLEGSSAEPILFGIDDAKAGSPTPEHPHDGHSCVLCGHRLEYTRAFVGHLGHYRCGRCRRLRPAPTVSALSVHEQGLEGARATISMPRAMFDVQLAQPGLHTVHNALAAAAAAVSLGVAPEVIRTGLQSMVPPFGRSETIALEGRTVHLCLVKNPVGVNATLRLLHADRRRHPLHLWLALNDGWADGRDVSWIWDADFERLTGLVGAATCSGRRAHELAVRLKYAGWSCPLLVEEDLDISLTSALMRAPEALIALPTYTALLALRGVLNRRGIAVSDWGTSARLGPKAAVPASGRGSRTSESRD